jgi:hypothetical protein
MPGTIRGGRVGMGVIGTVSCGAPLACFPVTLARI